MQLPEEWITYEYERLLAPVGQSWDALTELQSAHFLSPDRLEDIKPELTAVRSQIAAERELKDIPERLKPIDAGFIDLPQKLLDAHRRTGDASELGKVLRIAQTLQEQTGRVIILGIGGSYLGAKALFDSLCHTHHNEQPDDARLGKPRIYFEGNNVDNDALQDLLQYLEIVCVDPDLPAERWGLIAISKSGGTMETAAMLRVFRAEAARFYGSKSDLLKQLIVPITGPSGKMRELFTKDGYSADDILTIPDGVGGRYSVFTPVGLLPAATMGLDVRALLLGAATMTRRFLEEPFDRNPVLQYAAVNHILTTEHGKSIRVMSPWSKKLEAIGWWYDQLLSESLGKQGRGATPVTAVGTRDLHSRGQQHQDGNRDKVINNLIVKVPRHPGMPVGMADNNADDLNSLSRKTFPDLLNAAFEGTNKAYLEAARPTADLVLPMLSEHTIGQLLQMLMLATVVEGRLAGTNPYGQPGVEAYKTNMQAILRG